MGRSRLGRKRNSKGLKIALWVLVAIEAVLTILLLMTVLNKNMFPITYIAIFLGVIAGIIVLDFIAMRRKWSSIVMVIISIVVSLGLGYLVNFTGAATNTLNKITGDNQNVSTIQVAVLKSENINSVEELAGKHLAYSSNLGDEVYKSAKADIDGKASDIQYSKVNGITTLADTLTNKEADAIIINESYLDVLKEIDGYKKFGDTIKIIYSAEVKTNIASEDNKPVIPKDNEVFTVYISGIDTYGSTLKTSRSDVNIIAVVNMRTKHVLLVNTPRDYYVTHPYSNGVKDKLTHAGLYGVENSMGALANIYGIDINYYLRMNFTGFQKIIDSIGGIDVTSDYSFTSSLNRNYSYTAGVNHLNGEAALYFARERYSFSEGDRQRGKDQMAIITATIQKLTSSKEILLNYQNIFGELSDSFQTSVPQETLYKLINNQISGGGGWKIDNTSVTGSGASMTTYSIPSANAYVMIPDEASVSAAKEKIQSVLNEGN